MLTLVVQLKFEFENVISQLFQFLYVDISYKYVCCRCGSKEENAYQKISQNIHSPITGPNSNGSYWNVFGSRTVH